jgi:hypothetical protein
VPCLPLPPLSHAPLSRPPWVSSLHLASWGNGMCLSPSRCHCPQWIQQRYSPSGPWRWGRVSRRLGCHFLCCLHSTPLSPALSFWGTYCARVLGSMEGWGLVLRTQEAKAGDRTAQCDLCHEWGGGSQGCEHLQEGCPPHPEEQSEPVRRSSGARVPSGESCGAAQGKGLGDGWGCRAGHIQSKNRPDIHWRRTRSSFRLLASIEHLPQARHQLISPWLLP